MNFQRLFVFLLLMIGGTTFVSAGPNSVPKIEGRWLRREMVTIGGRPWADMRFVPAKKGVKDYAKAPLYTRFLGASYQGQLLEISFTANLETNPAVKAKIDWIMDSVRLEK